MTRHNRAAYSAAGPKGPKRRRGGAIAWVLGTAAVGIGAGLAAERLLVGRRRLRPDPNAAEPYGRVLPDRSYEVESFDGAVILVDEFGPATAKRGVVFLHGFCLDRTIWHHQFRAFDPTLRCLFYDARHHGRSRGGEVAPNTLTLAADLKAVLDRSGLTQAVLVGHSMGGMSVLEYCRERRSELGKRVRGVVLVNTTYTDALKTIFAAEMIGPLEKRLRRVLERLLADPRASRAMRLRGDDLSWMIARVGFGSGASPAQVEYLQRLLTSFPSPPLVEIIRGLRKFDIEDALHSIDVPALIIAGGSDRITTVRASRRMAEEIPSARLVVFERAGHMTMMEEHERFNALLGDFLSATIGRARRSGAAKQKTA